MPPLVRRSGARRIIKEMAKKSSKVDRVRPGVNGFITQGDGDARECLLLRRDELLRCRRHLQAATHQMMINSAD